MLQGFQCNGFRKIGIDVAEQVANQFLHDKLHIAFHNCLLYQSENVPFAQNEAHYQFAQNNYKNITKLCRSSRDIAEVIDEQQIELVIIGSDAVFTYVPKLSRFHLTRKGVIYSKPCIDSDFPNPFWGDFM